MRPRLFEVAMKFRRACSLAPLIELMTVVPSTHLFRYRVSVVSESNDSGAVVSQSSGVAHLEQAVRTCGRRLWHGYDRCRHDSHLRYSSRGICAVTFTPQGAGNQVNWTLRIPVEFVIETPHGC